jgi:cell division protease FtsH
MVTRYGMDEKLGQVTYDAERGTFLGTPMAAPWSERSYSEETAGEIDTAVRRIVGAAFDKALSTLQSRRDVLEVSARALLQKETLDEQELRRLVPAPVRHAA